MEAEDVLTEEQVREIERYHESLPHTPGPWAVEEDEKTGRPRVVSRAYHDEEPGICGDHSKHWPLSEDDARLISKAPQLREAALDALRTLTEAYEIESDRRQSIQLLTEALAGLAPR